MLMVESKYWIYALDICILIIKFNFAVYSEIVIINTEKQFNFLNK